VPPVISIVGRRHSGKTAVLEALVSELTRRGLCVGTLKHSVHGFEMDREGKDTWRHRRAGAKAVGIMSEREVAVIRTIEAELPLEQAVALLGPDLDLVLTEGFKRAATLKIEVIRVQTGCEVQTPPDQLLAVVADCPLQTTAPGLASGDTAALADLVVAHLGAL